MTARYVLTLAAEADLRDIIRYTGKQWGDTQTRSYVTKLQADMDRIAAGEGFFKDMSALYPRLRMVHCEHHYIFCLPRDDAPALVIGVFHERMDQGNLSLCGIPGRSAAGRAVDPEKITEASTDIFGDRHGGFVPVHHDQYAVLT